MTEARTFQQRLDKILPRLISDELLSNTGLGNEIGFYIFDYPPEHELEMREHIGFLLTQIPKKRPDIRVTHINLFHLLVDYLKDRKLLDRLIAEQRKNGANGKLLSELRNGPLKSERIAREFVTRANPTDHDLVMVSGVGNAYPLLRSHLLLKALHTPMGDTPLVMFYPGIYTGQGLRLFGKLSSSNYYRAFRLVL